MQLHTASILHPRGHPSLSAPPKAREWPFKAHGPFVFLCRAVERWVSSGLPQLESIVGHEGRAQTPALKAWCPLHLLPPSRELSILAPVPETTIHPCTMSSSDEGSSTDRDSSREATPPSNAGNMHGVDCSQPTAAVQEAIRLYDEVYGAGDWDEADVEGSEEDSVNGGGGSGSGGGSAGSRKLPTAAHDVFRKWLDEHPERDGKPTKDEIADIADDATAACEQVITKKQVRTHFNNLYVRRGPNRAAPHTMVHLLP